MTAWRPWPSFRQRSAGSYYGRHGSNFDRSTWNCGRCVKKTARFGRKNGLHRTFTGVKPRQTKFPGATVRFCFFNSFRDASFSVKITFRWTRRFRFRVRSRDAVRFFAPFATSRTWRDGKHAGCDGEERVLKVTLTRKLEVKLAPTSISFRFLPFPPINSIVRLKWKTICPKQEKKLQKIDVSKLANGHVV